MGKNPAENEAKLKKAQIVQRSLQLKAIWEFRRNSYNNILQMQCQMVQNCPQYMLDAKPNGAD